MGRELSKAQLCEKSITKKYRKEIWGPFITALKRYKLIEENDKIAVCISGGKDSMLMAKLLSMLKKYSEIPYDVVFLVMNPGYNEENLKQIKKNAKLLEIDITIFKNNIFSVADKADHSPCYLCAKMRRGALYSKAKELGCNKIALGHHLNDVIETTLMSMFYNSQIQTMPPKLKSTNFDGMELIRPLYCIKEEDILKWKRYNNLEFLQCACKFTKQNSAGASVQSKRLEVKQLIKELKKVNPDVEINLFNSVHSVCLDTMVGYKTHGETFDFNSVYPNRK